jgi:hypothetical protein
MAFLLYSEDQNGRWNLIQAIKLLPIVSDFVRDKWKGKRAGSLNWAMSEAQITSSAKRMHELAQGTYYVVIDLKPYEDGNVSLFRLQNIWGGNNQNMDSYRPSSTGCVCR